MVNFQKIILELTTVVDGCKGQVWGLKPAQGPLSSGYRKFNPGTALTRNWIKNKTWGTVQRWSSYPFMRPEVARGGREAAKQLLGRKTAKKLPKIWPNYSVVVFNSQFYNIQVIYKWKNRHTVHTNYSQVHSSQFNLIRSVRQFIVIVVIKRKNENEREGCVTIRYQALSLLWSIQS